VQFREMDRDTDMLITKNEYKRWIKTNEVAICKPFESEIEAELAGFDSDSDFTWVSEDEQNEENTENETEQDELLELFLTYFRQGDTNSDGFI
jgi:hypothetical protein